jgi:hypothetical protein
MLPPVDKPRTSTGSPNSARIASACSAGSIGIVNPNGSPTRRLRQNTRRPLVDGRRACSCVRRIGPRPTPASGESPASTTSGTPLRAIRHGYRPIIASRTTIVATITRTRAVFAQVPLAAPAPGLFDGRREASEALRRVDGQIGRSASAPRLACGRAPAGSDALSFDRRSTPTAARVAIANLGAAIGDAGVSLVDRGLRSQAAGRRGACLARGRARSRAR